MKKHPDHLLPLFKGKAAISLFDTMNHSQNHIQMKKKENTESTIRELLKEKIVFK